MSIRKGANRKVSFDTRDELEDKLDKLTVMLGRLAARDNSKETTQASNIPKQRKRTKQRLSSEKLSE